MILTIAAFLGSKTPITDKVGTTTIGTSGSVAGYDEGNYGSITGDITFGVPARRVRAMISSPSSDFQLEIDWTPDPGQTGVFTQITIDDGAGTPTVFTAAGATTYFSAGGTSFWIWGTGSSRLWETSDSGEVKNWTIEL